MVFRHSSVALATGDFRVPNHRAADGNLHPPCGFPPFVVGGPIQQLLALGIAHEISPYSYTDGTYAYLNEEDTVIFWWAREAMSQPCPCEIQLRATADPSPVRSLDRSAPPKVPVGMPVLVPVAEAADSSS